MRRYKTFVTSEVSVDRCVHTSISSAFLEHRLVLSADRGRSGGNANKTIRQYRASLNVDELLTGYYVILYFVPNRYLFHGINMLYVFCVSVRIFSSARRRNPEMNLSIESRRKCPTRGKAPK